MKVSRKLGRRKHSRSSSVSRRRLRNKKSRSGYKKRYAKTQKGGKRGRGQKRMRARTHKRGKRFHKGGKNMPLIGSVPPATIKWRKNDKWNVNFGYISNLRYKKK